MAFSWNKDALEAIVTAANAVLVEQFETAKENTVDPDSIAEPVLMSVIEGEKKKLTVANAVQLIPNSAVPDLAATLGTTVPSVRSKLTNLGLYIANAKVDKPKNASAPKVTRDVIVGNCEKLIEDIGDKSLNLSTFAKASKSSLEDLQEFLQATKAEIAQLKIDLEESDS